jgi:hypothetical protein
MSDPQLSALWRVRNAAADSLTLTEEHVRRVLREAHVDDLIALLETFSPARSTGPEWTRSFDPLIERLWLWRDDETMAALATAFRAKGVPWATVANALSPEHGAGIRASVRHPAWARLPAFTIA